MASRIGAAPGGPPHHPHHPHFEHDLAKVCGVRARPVALISTIFRARVHLLLPTSGSGPGQSQEALFSFFFLFLFWGAERRPGGARRGGGLSHRPGNQNTTGVLRAGGAFAPLCLQQRARLLNLKQALINKWNPAAKNGKKCTYLVLKY